MNSQWLSSFVAIAQSGSISRAAASLYVSPQALTQQINLLERELGFKVVRRSPKGVQLTDGGREFLDGVQRMTDLWDATLERCRQAPGAVRSVVTPTCVAFPAPDFETACHEYRRTRCPEEPVLEIVIQEDYKNWVHGLRDGAYDFVRYVRVGDIHPQGMHFEPLREVRPWCLMSADHPLASYPEILPEHLDGLRVAVSDLRVIRRLLDIMEAEGLTMHIWETPMSHLHIVGAVESGSICLVSEGLVASFDGYHAAPLACDLANTEGLLCPESQVEQLSHLFEVLGRHLRSNPI